MTPLFEGQSSEGRLVRLTLDRNDYRGAAPFYTVIYHTRAGTPQAARYTPFREIADHYVTRFLADLTDPARLVEGRPVGVTKPPARVEIPAPPESGSRNPRPERESDMGFVTSGRVGSSRGGRPRATVEAPTLAAARMRRYRARRLAAS
jgi:hypothetical protein